MRRKIVQHGSSSLTVSLPFKWAKSNGLKKGTEIEMTESSKSLRIQVGDTKESRSCRLEIKDSRLFFKRDIINLYKRGYDEVRLEFDDRVPLPEILDKIDELLGFEIIEHGKSYCIIRNVASPVLNEFESLLKRLFFLTQNMGEEIFAIIQAEDFEKLSGMIKTEKENNKLANFCQRLLISHGFDDILYTTSSYTVVEQLEMIGDAFGDLSFHLDKSSQKPTNEILRLFKDLLDYFRGVISVFYKRDRKKLLELKKQRIDLYKISDEFITTKRKMPFVYIYYLKQILESLHHIECSIVDVK